MQVLVVENDTDYALVIAETLRVAGHQVVTAGSTESARQFVAQAAPGLAILAADIPNEEGLDLCQWLRDMFPDMPIVLIAAPGYSSSIVRGFARGADDYIVKPFHPGELSVRVAALLRRVQSASRRTETMLSASGLSLDQQTRSVAWEGRVLECTQTEFAILQELMSAPGHVVAHTYLNAQIWGYRSMHDGSLLKSHVSSMRKKLREAGCQIDLIRSVHGVGYLLSVDEAPPMYVQSASA